MTGLDVCGQHGPGARVGGVGGAVQPDSGDSWHASYLNHTRITSTGDKEGTDRETSQPSL